MSRSLALLLFLALPGVAPGQRPPQAPPVDLRRVARAVEEAVNARPPQAPPEAVDPFAPEQGRNVSDRPVYDRAYEMAMKDGLPLVVFIGEARWRKVPGCLTCRINTSPAFPESAIYALQPRGEGMGGRKLPPAASDDDIAAAFQRLNQAVQQAVAAVQVASLQFAPVFPPMSFGGGGRGGSC
jgi:hypothetical protein